MTMQVRDEAAAASNMTSAGVATARDAGASMLQAAGDRLPNGTKEKGAALAAAAQEMPEKVLSCNILSWRLVPT